MAGFGGADPKAGNSRERGEDPRFVKKEIMESRGHVSMVEDSGTGGSMEAHLSINSSGRDGEVKKS